MKNSPKSVFKKLIAEGKMIPVDKRRSLTEKDLVVGGAVASAGGEIFEFNAPYPYDQLFGISP